MKYFLLTLGLGLLIVGAIFFNSITGAVIYREPVFESLDPSSFKEKANSDVVIIDIRTPQEYSQGMIEGAINVDFYSPSFRQDLSALDKDKTYLIYCRTGSRTSQAVSVMQDLGFNQVYVLNGGIVNWYNNRLPISSPL